MPGPTTEIGSSGDLRREEPPTHRRRHPRTRVQSDSDELLDAIRAGDDIDVIGEVVCSVLRELIEIKATERTGAMPFERAESRTTQRNGNRERLLSTEADDVTLKAPKLGGGSFFPSILAGRWRIDRVLFAVVMEACAHGVSTRKLDDLVQALGPEPGISKSEVSRICAELVTQLVAFKTDQDVVAMANDQHDDEAENGSKNEASASSSRSAAGASEHISPGATVQQSRSRRVRSWRLSRRCHRESCTH